VGSTSGSPTSSGECGPIASTSGRHGESLDARTSYRDVSVTMKGNVGQPSVAPILTVGEHSDSVTFEDDAVLKASFGRLGCCAGQRHTY